jgi:ferritin-like metal-binding protein YciE
VPKMTSPKELFIHELQDVYYAEKTLTKVLPTLASESTDRELTKAFKHHLAETRDQIQNLEQVFKNLGRRAEGQPCPGIDGIKEEHDDFMRENDPSEILCDVFLTGAASRTEHYEIAAYTGLISKARALGERESVKLLQENLRQEKEALKTVDTISKRILKSAAKPATKRAKSRTSSRSTGTSRRATPQRSKQRVTA